MKRFPVVFTSKTCGACIQQVEVLKNFLKGKNGYIMMVDVDKHDVPFIEFTPTWYIPNKNGTYDVYNSVILNPKDLSKLILQKRRTRGTRRTCSRRRRTSRFGQDNDIPSVGTLARDGKNFPDHKGFNIPNSFSNTIEATWGKGNDALVSGTLGRDQPPGSFANVLSNGYVNNIRMDRPGDQLESALSLNRTCNASSNMFQYPGLIPGAPNPQINSNTTGFGKRNRRRRVCFGNYLNSNMGPAYGSQYLINKDTGRQVFGGGLSDNDPRPQGVQNKDIYVGQGAPYIPFKGAFGKVKRCKSVCSTKKSPKTCKTTSKTKVCVKKSIKRCVKKCKISEGSVLTLKGKKIKVKRS
jgi:hypothetical protein